MPVFLYVVRRNFSVPDIAISGIKREVEEEEEIVEEIENHLMNVNKYYLARKKILNSKFCNHQTN